MAKSKAEEFDFEKTLEDLEVLVSRMEEGELSLEESLQAFEQGIKMTRACQSALKSAEQKVQLLMNEQGETEALNLDSSDD